MVFAAFGFVQAAEKPAPADAATLSSLTQEALSKNPKITAAWRKWNALRARIGQAKAWDDPKVSFDVTAGRFVEMPPNAMADQTLILEQMIPVSGKNVSRGRIAAAEAITGYEDFRRQQLDVASDVNPPISEPANAARAETYAVSMPTPSRDVVFSASFYVTAARRALVVARQETQWHTHRV